MRSEIKRHLADAIQLYLEAATTLKLDIALEDKAELQQLQKNIYGKSEQNRPERLRTDKPTGVD